MQSIFNNLIRNHQSASVKLAENREKSPAMIDVIRFKSYLRLRKGFFIRTFDFYRTVAFGINIMGDKYQIPYINACIRAFAKRFQLSVKTAFEYLYNFEGIHFLIEFYEIEHLQSIDDAVDDLIVYCINNGGTLR